MNAAGPYRFSRNLRNISKAVRRSLIDDEGNPIPRGNAEEWQETSARMGPWPPSVKKAYETTEVELEMFIQRLADHCISAADADTNDTGMARIVNQAKHTASEAAAATMKACAVSVHQALALPENSQTRQVTHQALTQAALAAANAAAHAFHDTVHAVGKTSLIIDNNRLEQHSRRTLSQLGAMAATASELNHALAEESNRILSGR